MKEAVHRAIFFSRRIALFKFSISEGSAPINPIIFYSGIIILREEETAKSLRFLPPPTRQEPLAVRLNSLTSSLKQQTIKF